MLEKHIEHEEHMLSTLTDASSDPHVAAPNAHVESWAAELSQLREHLANDDLHAAVAKLNSSSLNVLGQQPEHQEPAPAVVESTPAPSASHDLHKELHKARVEQRSKLMAELQEKTAELEAGLAQIDRNHAIWEHNFELEVEQAEREMCEQPFRRERPDCIKLLAKLAKQEQAQSSNASTVAAVPQDAALRHGRNRLQWPSAWSGDGWLSGITKGRGSLMLRRSKLDASRWAGDLPKVACITVISSGKELKDKMFEFLTNFYMNSYEGHVKLVLVYHHTDEEAAHWVSMYTTSVGADIVGVASFDNGTFPSVTALRYGAWSVREDVQVIAQWDFGVKHDQHRLSTQVRALASSSRPASLLKNSSVLSLTGEAKWMDRYWRPEVDQQTALQEHLSNGQVVEVDLDA